MLIKCSKLNNLTSSLGVCAAKKKKKKKGCIFHICSHVVKCKKKIVYLELKDE